MKAVPLVTNPNRFVRSMDVMPKARLYITACAFLCASFVSIFCLIYGPGNSNTESIPFDSSSISGNSKKFTVKVGHFNLLNEFVTLDAYFIRESPNGATVIQVGTSVIVHGHKGRRTQLVFENSLHSKSLYFSDLSTLSNKIRLFSTKLVEFEDLEFEIILKFPENQAMSGVFTICYNNAAYSFISLLLRVIFLLISVIVLIYWHNINLEKTEMPYQLGVIKTLLIFTIIGSNAIYAFSYFTDSLFLPLFDATVSLVFIVAVASGTLLLLDSTRMTDEQTASTMWLLKEILPFLIAGFFYFVNEIIVHFRLEYDPMGTQTSFLQILGHVRILASSICCLRLIIAVIDFKPQAPASKFVIACMVFTTIITAIITEMFTRGDAGHVTHKIQIFTYAIVATYVLFMARMYWPAVDEGE